MKKIVLYMLTLCLALMVSPNLRGQIPPSDTSQVPIPIIKEGDYHPSTGPKSPSLVKIQAYYDCATHEIVVTAQNAGIYINVCVENLVSGDEFLQSISGTGVSFISISGTSGFWQITLYLDDGAVYIGNFSI